MWPQRDSFEERVLENGELIHIKLGVLVKTILQASRAHLRGSIGRRSWASLKQSRYCGMLVGKAIIFKQHNTAAKDARPSGTR